jgi:glycerol transport system substrate-binding protein
MNPVMTPEYWYKKSAADGNLAPQRKLDNEKPKGETIAYEDLIKSWSAPDSNKG